MFNNIYNLHPSEEMFGHILAIGLRDYVQKIARHQVGVSTSHVRLMKPFRASGARAGRDPPVRPPLLLRVLRAAEPPRPLPPPRGLHPRRAEGGEGQAEGVSQGQREQDRPNLQHPTVERLATPFACHLLLTH